MSAHSKHDDFNPFVKGIEHYTNYTASVCGQIHGKFCKFSLSLQFVSASWASWVNVWPLEGYDGCH